MEKRDIFNLAATKIHPILSHKRTLGQRAADVLTELMGSWTFIIVFFIFLILWILFNSVWFFFGETWDRRPFVMLNLILSCLAALQAPIILMSQNREAQKDRLRAKYDYAVNRKAEKEIEEIKRQLDGIEKRLR